MGLPWPASSAIDVRSVLDAADVEHPVAGKDPEGHPVITAPRDPPPFELRLQRLGHTVGVGGQHDGDELGDRSSDFVR